MDLARVLDLDVMEIIDTAGTGRSLTKERSRLEAAIALSVRSLSDTALEVAVAQIAALERIR